MEKKQSVLPPQVPRPKAFLESLNMSKNPIEVFARYTEALGDTYSFHLGGMKKAMVTSSPGVIQHVLQKNYANYQKSDIQVKRMGHFLGHGLLTSHGKYWLTQRRLIQEGFQKDKLSSFTRIMDQVIMQSLEKMDQKNENGQVDVTALMLDLTFRMVMSTLYSNSLRDNELKKIGSTISTIQEFIIRQIVQPYLNPWFKVSGQLRKYENMRVESDKIIMEIIKNRRIAEGGESDMLQILLDAKYKETGEGMTDEQILMESMQLIVAGHETSSNALSWILYLMASHPDCLQKVKEEIDHHAGNAPLDIGNMMKLEYTVQVIEESLRIYPPFWMVDRVAVEDDEAMGYFIPKDTMVLVFIHGLHHSSKYWQDPEVFNPDRFTKQQMKNHLPFTHIPFGGGPRVCIGVNYAMLQMLMIITRIVSRYDITLAQKHAAEIEPMIILRPKGKINMHFKQIYT